jgi:dynein heavy chain 1
MFNTSSQGFISAESLAAKVVSVFQTCEVQLSSQNHYDFGLRALKSVLASAGGIRRGMKATDIETLTAGDEERIVSDAFKGSILPKLLKDDAATLLEVLARVFTLQSVSFNADVEFNAALALSCKALHLSPSSEWVEKLIQIKQLVRFVRFVLNFQCFADFRCSIHHGIMLVGPSGTGKSSAFRFVIASVCSAVSILRRCVC